MPAVNSKPAFPIQKLPDLVLEMVVGLMANKQRLALVLTSKKTESLVLPLKFPKDQIHMVYFAENSCGFVASIQVKDHGEDAPVMSFDCTVRKGAEPEKDEIQQWCDVAGDFVERAQTVYRKIQRLFPVCGMSLRLLNVSTENVAKILESSEFKHWWEVCTSGDMQPEAIKLIMDQANSNRRIICDNEIKLPMDFYHPKVFGFKTAQYSVAKWAKLDQLLTIREAGMIGLGQTSLRCGDVNILLQKMLDTKYQMVNRFEISVTGGFDAEVMMKDLLKFQMVDGEQYTIFACSQTKTNSKLALISTYRNLIRINITTDEEEFETARRVLALLKKRISINEEMKKSEDFGEIQRFKIEIEQLGKECAEAAKELIDELQEEEE